MMLLVHLLLNLLLSFFLRFGYCHEAEQSETEDSETRQYNETIQIPALGREFKLGSYYDIRNDKIMPGNLFTACKHPNAKSEKNFLTKVDIMAGQKIFDNMKAYDLSQDMVLNILSGLTDLSGSDNYLLNLQLSSFKAIVGLKYEKHIYTEWIPLKKCKEQSKCDKIQNCSLYLFNITKRPSTTQIPTTTDEFTFSSENSSTENFSTEMFSSSTEFNSSFNSTEAYTTETYTTVDPITLDYQSEKSHVVIEIIYGGTGTFSFEQVVKNYFEKQVSEDHLQKVLRLKAATINDKMVLNLTEKEKKVYQNSQCQFHGNVEVDLMPTDFQGANSLFHKLPDMMTESNSVPLYVTLAPINLFAEAENLQNKWMEETDPEFIYKLINKYQKYIELIMTVNDLLIQTEKYQFHLVKQQVKALQFGLESHKSAFDLKVRNLLPKLRAGVKTADVELNKAINDEGTYSLDEFRLLLQIKHEEIAALIGIVNWDIKLNGDQSMLISIGKPKEHLIWQFKESYLFVLELKLYQIKYDFGNCEQKGNGYCYPGINNKSWLIEENTIKQNVIDFLKLKELIEMESDLKAGFAISLEDALDENDDKYRADLAVYTSGARRVHPVPTINNISVQHCNRKLDISWNSENLKSDFLGSYSFELIYKLKTKQWAQNLTEKWLSKLTNSNTVSIEWHGEDMELQVIKRCYLMSPSNKNEISIVCGKISKNITAMDISTTSTDYCRENISHSCIYKLGIQFERLTEGTAHYADETLEDCCQRCLQTTKLGEDLGCVGFSFYSTTNEDNINGPWCAIYEEQPYSSFETNITIKTGIVIGRGMIPYLSD